jgi:hypothetical protein
MTKHERMIKLGKNDLIHSPFELGHSDFVIFPICGIINL